MGQILHGCAKTTQTIRRAIQNRKESIAKLSKHYNLNPKTIIKWRKRSFTKDADMGPKHPRSTVLTLEEEAIIVTFRKYTLLPLDDCLYALQSTIPHLTRSSLHRCLQRHNISRLPTVDGEVKSKKKFKQYPIGYFHIDIAEVRTEEGKLHLFVAIDRTSKFTYVELCNSATKPIAAEFLRNLIRILPYKIHTILTDNGIQFTNQKRHKYAFQHIFDRVCEENVIEHRLTKVSHPWTNGQVERMNKTLKDATVKKYYYQSHQQLKEHLYNFVMAYNYAKRLKTLKGLTPYEFICYQWTQSPELFILNPHHHTLGPYILDVVKFLVNKGADISVKDKDSKTPLDLAAQENNTSVAEFLKQTELDKKLLAAVQDTGLNEVKDLINQKANINAKDMYGWTPLHFAASRNKLSVVEFLFNNNANINAKDVYGNTPLHVAAQYSSNLEIVKFLLDKDISGINNITNNGWTPLHVAIQGNKLNTVELLLGRGADIEVRDIYNQTSLDLATRKGYLDIAGILKQVQLDRKLLTIVESGGFNEAKGLIAQGANIDTNDKNGNTLLYSAAEIGDLNLVKLLLDNGANIEAKNGEYQATPLHGAVENYRIDVVKLLLNRGANVNAEDKDNWTPLHYGADTNSPDIVKVLVDAHANLGAKGNYGKTPLDIAKDKGHNNIVEYLEKKLRGGRGERKRRHHHGDHNSHNLSRKPLAIDQPQIATSSGAKPSSWINDLFSRVKSSVGRLLSSKSEGTASSLSQVDGQFAKASISNSSFTGTTLPSDGTDKRQENGGFFRDNVDYVNANLKRMCERQAPVKFKPKDRNTILEMGDHYLSQVDFNGTITLFDLLIRRVTGQKYISTIDQSISPLEAQEYTLNITKGFEKVVEQAGLKSGVSMHRLNIDFVEIQKEVTGKIMSGKFDEISGIFNSYVEKACSGKEAGKLSPKKFEKFIAQFNKGLLNQSIEQILHNRDGRLEVDGTKKQQISLEPQSYLSNASVHSHSEVSTCLSEIGVTKLGGNINR